MAGSAVIGGLCCASRQHLLAGNRELRTYVRRAAEVKTIMDDKEPIAADPARALAARAGAMDAALSAEAPAARHGHGMGLRRPWCGVQRRRGGRLGGLGWASVGLVVPREAWPWLGLAGCCPRAC